MNDLPRTIDEYLSLVPVDKRVVLESLRQTIRRIVPDAEEVIWYRLPSFRLHGKMLVSFGAAARHCALYPLSAAVIERFQDALAGYSTSKGTIRFQPEHPLPPELLRDIILMRIDENAGKIR